MLFCTQAFLIFFVCIFLVYWALPWHRARNYLLLVASFYFYSRWSLLLACIVLASAMLDYALARGMEAAKTQRIRKLFLTTSIVANLGLLCYFKYANFFLDSLRAVLHEAGLEMSWTTLQVMATVGISFYTFEAINYTVEVFRRQVKAERDPAKFLLFILFFPHLVAGPIVRARDFLPQIRRRKRWNWVRMEVGIRFIVMGLFKKLAIADRMVAFVDPVFEAPQQFKTYALWLAVVAYTLQVYCDFSGYSDLAMGTAHLLGFRLAQNFDRPYMAANITDFWRRWHMSLSSWLRDYLFIPLGGSRGGRLLTYRNLLITMTLCGLWHGANWNFVVFGAVQGLMLIVHHSFAGWCKERPTLSSLLESFPGTAVRIAFTYFCFTTSLVIFRSSTLGSAATMLGQMFMPVVGQGTPLPDIGLWLTVAVVLGAHVWAWRGWGLYLLARCPAPMVSFSYVLVACAALVLAPENENPFIYFQF
jgi:alginate O-acetyltransferase complex protein AlgI